MSDRVKLTDDTEEYVLSASRRRCAICFGLNRDTNMKLGQIAHLDGNSANNEHDNLVYLCFDHHALYDSRSRQAKGFTVSEVQHYRNELHSAIVTEWNKPIQFYSNSDPADPYSKYTGHYILEGTNSSAEFTIKHLGGGIMDVQGFALWGTQTPTPHTGSVAFKSDLRNDDLYFADRWNESWYNLQLSLSNNILVVNESKLQGYHGMNVSFYGTYKKK